jgi:hypothetical protein
LYGNWHTKILGVNFYEVADPGGAYFGQGTTFFTEKYHPADKDIPPLSPGFSYPGHPGIPFILLMQTVVFLIYIAKWAVNTPYVIFVTHNLYWILLFTQLAMALINFTSAYLVYLVSKKLIGDKYVSISAAILFITSFTFLYYFNRLAPDGFVPFFIILSIIKIWDVTDNQNVNLGLQKYKQIVLSGVYFAFAAASKLMIVAPLFLIFPIYLAIQIRKKLPFKTFNTWLAPSLWFSSSSFTFYLLTWKLDWSDFTRFWMNWSPGKPQYLFKNSPIENIATNLIYTVREFFKLIADRLFIHPIWMPGPTTNGIFYPAEMLFFVLGLFGLIMYWKISEERIKSLVIVIIATLFTVVPVIILRTEFHYFFIIFALLSPFAAFGIDIILKKKFPNAIKSSYYILLIAVVFILHLPSITLNIIGYTSNIRQYKKWAQAYEIIDKLEVDDHICLDSNYTKSDILAYTSHYLPYTSPMKKALEDLIIVTTPNPLKEYISKTKCKLFC